MNRTSGILLHISSLPNTFGIGSFGQSAYDFIDFLVKTEQTYWQILPLGPTSYGDSPYQAFSAFALNTHFIDLDLLLGDNLLSWEDYQSLSFAQSSTQIDYGRLFQMRHHILAIAVRNFLKQSPQADFNHFRKKQAFWLDDYAEFMALKDHFQLVSCLEWPEAIRLRRAKQLDSYRTQLQEEILYYQVTQYFCYKQWQALKAYANRQHIQIIGDLPIYIATDSADFWCHPHLFKVDDANHPIAIAGTPPDSFSEEGQLWGNPLYNWQHMAQDNYEWWTQRMKSAFELYDLVRLDHFRGFESYWEVPVTASSAAEGCWVKGPGTAFFKQLETQLGPLPIIAEDLGVLTEAVIEMLEATAYPGMRILQFAFDGNDSMYLPHHYIENCVAYVGTHDNATALGWFHEDLNPQQQEQVLTYIQPSPTESIADALNRTIAASVAQLVIYTMQDLLNLDNHARMNTPATAQGNWQWRMNADALDLPLVSKLAKWTRTYFRSNPHHPLS